MDLISLGCAVVRSSPGEWAMNLFNYLGHGLFAGGIAVVIIAYGLARRNRWVGQVGLAALLAVLAAGLFANLLKLVFQMPRPDPDHPSYGFPSGHSTTAFALAGALAQAHPPAAPLFYLLALLASVARVYSRSHFVRDVIGGGLLGIGIGLVVGKRLLGHWNLPKKGPGVRWGWVLLMVIGAPALAFFMTYERTLNSERRSAQVPSVDASAPLVVTFGTPDAKRLLLAGWSEDERWEGVLMVWVLGLESKLRVDSLPPADHWVRLKVRPFVGRGLSCQVMEMAVNGVPVGRLLLENGWHDYATKVPKERIRPGPNEIRFRFAYAESPEHFGQSQDRRALSAGFASFEAVATESSSGSQAGR